MPLSHGHESMEDLESNVLLLTSAEYGRATADRRDIDETIAFRNPGGSRDA